MTRTILAFAIWISLLAPTAFAQEQKQFIVSQPCDNVLSMTETIMNKYGEQPLFVGNGNQLSASNSQWYSSSMMYFVNQESGTWSLVSLYPDGTGCMVAAGTKFEPYTD
jgi:hypothetical protein